MIGKFTDETYTAWEKYIKSLLHKWSTPANMYDDFIQEMFVVLCECNQQFDENVHRCSFDTFAYNQMRWKWCRLMKEYYKNNNIEYMDEIDVFDSEDDQSINDILQTASEILSDEEYDMIKIYASEKDAVSILSRKLNISRTTIYKKIREITKKIKKEMGIQNGN